MQYNLIHWLIISIFAAFVRVLIRSATLTYKIYSFRFFRNYFNVSLYIYGEWIHTNKSEKKKAEAYLKI